MQRQKWLALVFLAPTFVWSAEQTYQPGPEAARNRYLSFNNQDRLPYLAVAQGDNFYYASLLWLDLSRQPKEVTNVQLELFCVDIGPANPTISMKGYRIISNWDSNLASDAKVSARYAGTIKAPKPGAWYRINITSIYQRWQDGSIPNCGLGFAPTTDSKGWSIFCGSDHSVTSLRPRLVITVAEDTTTPSLIFPLVGADRQKAISGYRFGDPWQNRYCADTDKLTVPLLHDGIDYWASWNDPVHAITGGKISLVITDSSYGGLVTVAHANNTWTSTYVHILPEASLVEGQTVDSSTRLGTINTGNSGYGPHLHLQLRQAPYDRGRCMIGVYPLQSCHVRSGGLLIPAWPEYCFDATTQSWRDRP